MFILLQQFILLDVSQFTVNIYAFGARPMYLGLYVCIICIESKGRERESFPAFYKGEDILENFCGVPDIFDRQCEVEKRQEVSSGVEKKRCKRIHSLPKFRSRDNISFYIYI
jgi:hypothetical protein